MSRQPRGESSRARTVRSSTTTSVGKPVDPEALDEVGALALVDDEDAEGAVVAPALEHLSEESLHAAALPRERRGEEDQPRSGRAGRTDRGNGRHAVAPSRTAAIAN